MKILTFPLLEEFKDSCKKMCTAFPYTPSKNWTAGVDLSFVRCLISKFLLCAWFLIVLVLIFTR